MRGVYVLVGILAAAIITAVLPIIVFIFPQAREAAVGIIDVLEELGRRVLGHEEEE